MSKISNRDRVGRGTGTVALPIGRPDHAHESFSERRPVRCRESQRMDHQTRRGWRFDWVREVGSGPDGKRFVVLPRPDATGEPKGSVHVTVPLNFFWRPQLKMFGESPDHDRGRESKGRPVEKRMRVTEAVTCGASALFAVCCGPAV
jgi:hypothetical protein